MFVSIPKKSGFRNYWKYFPSLISESNFTSVVKKKDTVHLNITFHLSSDYRYFCESLCSSRFITFAFFHRKLNNGWALQQAKTNVDRYYSVVGILEEMNTTLRVLEREVPYFFKGVLKKYEQELLREYNNFLQ